VRSRADRLTAERITDSSSFALIALPASVLRGSWANPKMLCFVKVSIAIACVADWGGPQGTPTRKGLLTGRHFNPQPDPRVHSDCCCFHPDCARRVIGNR
jgi:hypothetical protein